ncbi:MAG: GNAT family N-acetyltransferase [Chitinophagaceae bacterium]
MDKINILPYQKTHQSFFEAVNRAWIESMFEMEPTDEWVLQNPEEALINPGGAILVAEYDGAPAGVVGLRKLDSACYELTKMAVDVSFRRKGIAKKLMLAAIDKALEMGATELILYSNRKNAAAIILYEQIGFRHVSVEPGVYERANVKMVIDASAMKHISATLQEGLHLNYNV